MEVEVVTHLLLKVVVVLVVVEKVEQVTLRLDFLQHLALEVVEAVQVPTLQMQEVVLQVLLY